MTEAEWLSATEPKPMLAFVRDTASRRKSRLLVCAACRRIWPRLTDERGRTALAVTERWIDGEVTREEYVQAAEAADKAMRYAWRGASEASDFPAGAVAFAVERDMPLDLVLELAAAAGCNPQAADTSGPNAHAGFIRDVLGNPFHPVVLDPRWQTADVLGLALAIYMDRVFDRLPILADALMDAGCDNEDILTHCRSDGPHVRGCWVIDLVLGKE